MNFASFFNEVITLKEPPRNLSSDNDPLLQFHRWQANLRILNIEEIKSFPYTPISLGLEKYIHRLPIPVDSSPQVMLLDINSHEDFINEKGITIASVLTLQSSSV